MTFLEGGSRTQVCLIKAGQYTGDGTESQTIEVGFPPLMVWLYPFLEAGAQAVIVYVKHVSDSGTLCLIGFDAAGRSFKTEDGRVLGFTATGFIVDDAGTDTDPNADTVVYNYTAWGG